MSVLLIALVLTPAWQDAPRPSIAKLWPKLKDVSTAQRDQLKKITDDYAAQIAELEAERDQKLAALLTPEQRTALAALAAKAAEEASTVSNIAARKIFILILLSRARARGKESRASRKGAWRRSRTRYGSRDGPAARRRPRRGRIRRRGDGFATRRIRARRAQRR